eukprot:CAMPEP_0114226664 /NCGR_PEP_ID=MMETSP0058-20121206/1357_1 /TAXON_ID=36894 /ORGANISM="Pyramimonas parkeae, CCMP726" /LENGTH=195 /DNA_ID=CAMNT_0001337413 /DNA_START=455 /DNA_END=1042 /DNA_ORIENTATION=-
MTHVLESVVWAIYHTRCAMSALVSEKSQDLEMCAMGPRMHGCSGQDECERAVTGERASSEMAGTETFEAMKSAFSLGMVSRRSTFADESAFALDDMSLRLTAQHSTQEIMQVQEGAGADHKNCDSLPRALLDPDTTTTRSVTSLRVTIPRTLASSAKGHQWLPSFNKLVSLNRHTEYQAAPGADSQPGEMDAAFF